MTARPGSTWWLLRHEVQMVFYNWRTPRGNGKLKAPWFTLLMLAVLQLGLHWGSWHLARAVSAHAIPATMLSMLLAALVVTGATLMLSAALRGSVDALFERGDLDLLLASPLPASTIFFTRLLGIVVSVSAMFLFFVAPLAHMALLAGQPAWLAIYVAVFAMAFIIASTAMLLTLGLVRLIGARRTRVVAQVLSAFSGALIFLASQAGNVRSSLGPGLMRWLGGLWTPALEAALLWLLQPATWLVLLGLGLALFRLTTRYTRGFFIHGVQQAASAGRVVRAPRGGLRFHFGRSLGWSVMLKEWRLMARDVQLLSQVLLRLLYLLPLCLVIFTQTRQLSYATGAALVFLSTSLTGSLSWVIMAAEDHPDLLASAPRRAALLARAKLAAAIMPPLLLVTAPVVWLALNNPLSAVILALTLVLGTLSTACIVLWGAKPSARVDFAKQGKGKGNALNSISQTLNGMAWAGLTLVLLWGGPRSLLWAAAAVALALGLLLLAWVTGHNGRVRRRRTMPVVAAQVATGSV